MTLIIFHAVLVVQCSVEGVPGRETYICNASNPIASITCSFDGGQPENCTFPLELTIDRFGTDNHTLVLTIVDMFGQTFSREFEFTLIERERHIKNT